MWGPTKKTELKNVPGHISIHGPRVGADRQKTEGKSETKNFNPRPPCGGRLAAPERLPQNSIISIHGPRVGADAQDPGKQSKIFRISIHGPRVGADPLIWTGLSKKFEFQSTAPVWGPTTSYR